MVCSLFPVVCVVSRGAMDPPARQGQAAHQGARGRHQQPDGLWASLQPPQDMAGREGQDDGGPRTNWNRAWHPAQPEAASGGMCVTVCVLASKLPTCFILNVWCTDMLYMNVHSAFWIAHTKCAVVISCLCMATPCHDEEPLCHSLPSWTLYWGKALPAQQNLPRITRYSNGI